MSTATDAGAETPTAGLETPRNQQHRDRFASFEPTAHGGERWSWNCTSMAVGFPGGATADRGEPCWEGRAIMMGDALTLDLDTEEMPTTKRPALLSRPEPIEDSGRTASMTLCARAPRIQVCLLVSFEVDSSFFVGLTENLSEGGVFVATRAVRSVGSRIDLGIMFPEEEPMRARGTVVWLRPSSGQRKCSMPGMGIRFDGLASFERARIRDLAQAHDAALEQLDWEIDLDE